MASPLDQLNRGRGVSVYAPALQRAIAPTRRTTPPRPRQYASGTGSLIDRINAGQRDAQKAEDEAWDDLPWWKKGAATVLDNPITRAAMVPLDVLDRGRRLGVMASEELAKALPEWAEPFAPVVGPLAKLVDEDKAREDERDFWDKFNDPNYGFGQVAGDLGTPWLNNVQGFLGDVALDPLTYLTAGLGKAAVVPGRAGRVAAASKAARTIGDDAIRESMVNRMGTLGPGVMTSEELALAGVEAARPGIIGRSVERIAPGVRQRRLADPGMARQGIRFAGQRIPGTEGIAIRVNRAFAEARLAVNRTRVGRAAGRLRYPQGLEAEYDRLLTGKGRMSATAAATWVGFDNARRRGAGVLKHSFEREMNKLGHNLRGRDAINMTHAAEQVGGTAWNELDEAVAVAAEKVGVKIDRRVTSGPAGDPLHHVPHVGTKDGRAWMRGEDPSAIAFRDTFGLQIDDIDEATGVTMHRKFVARDKPYIIGGKKGADGKYIPGTGREFWIRKGTIEEINEEFNRVFPEAGNIKLLDDNITSIYANYLTRLSDDAGKVFAAREMLASKAGLILPDDDLRALVEKVDEVAMKNATDAARAEFEQSVRELKQTANKLRQDIASGLDAITGRMSPRVQEALDEMETARKGVVEALKKLYKDNDTLSKNSDQARALIKSEQEILDREIQAINDRIAELRRASINDIDALEWMKPALREARGVPRRVARKKLIQQLQVRQARLAHDHELLTVLRQELDSVTRKEELLRRGLEGPDAERFIQSWGGEPRQTQPHAVPRYTGEMVKDENGIWRPAPAMRDPAESQRARTQTAETINRYYDGDPNRPDSQGAIDRLILNHEMARRSAEQAQASIPEQQAAVQAQASAAAAAREAANEADAELREAREALEAVAHIDRQSGQWVPNRSTLGPEQRAERIEELEAIVAKYEAWARSGQGGQPPRMSAGKQPTRKQGDEALKAARRLKAELERNEAERVTLRERLWNLREDIREAQQSLDTKAARRLRKEIDDTLDEVRRLDEKLVRLRMVDMEDAIGREDQDAIRRLHRELNTLDERRRKLLEKADKARRDLTAEQGSRKNARARQAEQQMDEVNARMRALDERDRKLHGYIEKQNRIYEQSRRTPGQPITNHVYDSAKTELRRLRAEAQPSAHGRSIKSDVSTVTARAGRVERAEVTLQRQQAKAVAAERKLGEMQSALESTIRALDTVPTPEQTERAVRAMNVERQQRLRAARENPPYQTPIMGMMPGLGEGAAGRVPLEHPNDTAEKIGAIIGEQAAWTPPPVTYEKWTPKRGKRAGKVTRRPVKRKANLQAHAIRQAVDTSPLDWKGSGTLRARAERLVADVEKARAMASELADQGLLEPGMYRRIQQAQYDLDQAIKGFKEYPSRHAVDLLRQKSAQARRLSDFTLRYGRAVAAGAEPSEGMRRYIAIKVLQAEDLALRERRQRISVGRLRKRKNGTTVRVYEEVVDEEVERLTEVMYRFIEDMSNATNEVRWAQELTKMRDLSPAERIVQLRQRIEINRTWQDGRRQRLRNLKRRLKYVQEHPESVARKGLRDQFTKGLDDNIAWAKLMIGQYENQQRLLREGPTRPLRTQMGVDPETGRPRWRNSPVTRDEYETAKRGLPGWEAERERRIRSREQRKTAQQRAHDVRVAIRSGQMTLTEALYSDDPAIRGSSVRLLITALPNTGPVKADRIMAELKIAPTARVRSLRTGQRSDQRVKLLEALGQDPRPVGPLLGEGRPSAAARQAGEAPRAVELQKEIDRLERDIRGANDAIRAMEEELVQSEVTGVTERMAAVSALFEDRLGRPFTEDEKQVLALAVGEDRAEVLDRWMYEFMGEHGESAPQVAYQMLMDMLPEDDAERLWGLAWEAAEDPEALRRGMFGFMTDEEGFVSDRAGAISWDTIPGEGGPRLQEPRMPGDRDRSKMAPRAQSEADVMHLVRGFAIMSARDQEQEMKNAALEAFDFFGFRKARSPLSDEQLAKLTPDQLNRMGATELEGKLRTLGYNWSTNSLDRDKLHRAVTMRVNRDREGLLGLRERMLNDLDWEQSKLRIWQDRLGRPSSQAMTDVPPPPTKQVRVKIRPKKGETPEERGARIAENARIDVQNDAIRNFRNLRWQRRQHAQEALGQRKSKRTQDITKPSAILADDVRVQPFGRPARISGGKERVETVIAHPLSPIGMDWRVPFGMTDSPGSFSRGSVNAQLQTLARTQKVYAEAEQAAQDRLAQLTARRQQLEETISGVEDDLRQTEQVFTDLYKERSRQSGSLVRDVEEAQARVQTRWFEGWRFGLNEADAKRLDAVARRDELTAAMAQIDEDMALTRAAILAAEEDKDLLMNRGLQLKADLAMLSKKVPKKTAELQTYIDDLDRIALAMMDEGFGDEVAIIHELLQTAAVQAGKLAQMDMSQEMLDTTLKQIKNGTMKLNVPDAIVQELGDEWSLMFRKVNSEGKVIHSLTKEGEGIVFHKSLADSYRRVDQAVHSNWFWRMVEAFTSFFKTYVTASPGFQVRNALSALFMNISDGVSPKWITRSMKMWKEWVDDPIGYLERATPETRAAFEAVLGSSPGGQFIERGVGPRLTPKNRIFNNFYTRFHKWLGQWVEGPARLAMALDTVHNLRTLDGAADQALARITRVHFDYSQVSKFDITMKRLIPFWTFLSRNLPLQITQMWMRPRAYLWYQSFVRNFRSPDDEFVPSYWGEQGAFNTGWHVGDDPLYIAPDLPHTRVMEDVAKLHQPARLLSQANPLFRLPIEWATGERLYTGQQFRDDSFEKLDGELWPLAPVFGFLGQVDRGASGDWQVTQKAGYTARELLPPLKQISRMFPGGDDEFNADREAQTWLRYAGVPAFQLNEQAQASERRRRAAQVQKDQARRATLAGL